MANLVRAKISALGTYVPPRLLTNADLEKMVETSNEWIVERTGIRQRHIVEKGMATSDMAIEAANEALKQRGMPASEVEAIFLVLSHRTWFFQLRRASSRTRLAPRARGGMTSPPRVQALSMRCRPR